MAGQTEWEYRQRALAQFFWEHRQERGQLKLGYKVVVFKMNGHRAEIRAQGIFLGFRHEALGECIVLGTTDDEDEDTFPERLEHIIRMAGQGFVMPRHILERRMTQKESGEMEVRAVLLDDGALYADGEAYAQLNAITNIPREKPEGNG